MFSHRSSSPKGAMGRLSFSLHQGGASGGPTTPNVTPYSSFNTNATNTSGNNSTRNFNYNDRKKETIFTRARHFATSFIFAIFLGATWATATQLFHYVQIHEGIIESWQISLYSGGANSSTTSNISLTFNKTISNDYNPTTGNNFDQQFTPFFTSSSTSKPTFKEIAMNNVKIDKTKFFAPSFMATLYTTVFLFGVTGLFVINYLIIIGCQCLLIKRRSIQPFCPINIEPSTETYKQDDGNRADMATSRAWNGSSKGADSQELSNPKFLRAKSMLTPQQLARQNELCDLLKSHVDIIYGLTLIPNTASSAAFANTGPNHQLASGLVSGGQLNASNLSNHNAGTVLFGTVNSPGDMTGNRTLPVKGKPRMSGKKTALTRVALHSFLWCTSLLFYTFTAFSLTPSELTAIYASHLSFTYAFSWVLLHEKFLAHKVIATVCFLTSIILLTHYRGEFLTYLGNVLLIVLSATFYALFKVNMKNAFVTNSTSKASHHNNLPMSYNAAAASQTIQAGNVHSNLANLDSHKSLIGNGTINPNPNTEVDGNLAGASKVSNNIAQPTPSKPKTEPVPVNKNYLSPYTPYPYLDGKNNSSTTNLMSQTSLLSPASTLPRHLKKSFSRLTPTPPLIDNDNGAQLIKSEPFSASQFPNAALEPQGNLNIQTPTFATAKISRVQARFAVRSFFYLVLCMCSLLYLWPLAIMLHLTHVEYIQWKSIPWFYLLIAACLHTAYTLLLEFGAVSNNQHSPTFGIFFGVVLNTIADIYIGRLKMNRMLQIAFSFNFLGFVLLVLPKRWHYYTGKVIKVKRISVTSSGPGGKNSVTSNLHHHTQVKYQYPTTANPVAKRAPIITTSPVRDEKSYQQGLGGKWRNSVQTKETYQTTNKTLDMIPNSPETGERRKSNLKVTTVFAKEMEETSNLALSRKLIPPKLTSDFPKFLLTQKDNANMASLNTLNEVPESNNDAGGMTESLKNLKNFEKIENLTKEKAISWATLANGVKRPQTLQFKP